MILPDVNVLLYAFRADSTNHSAYRKWLLDLVGGPASYGLSPQVLASVVRIATHPRIFARPSTLEETLRFAGALLAPTHCQVINPGPRHWGIFSSLCTSVQAAGNLVQDAWFAALAIEHGCEWITTDRDFRRFQGLRHRTPF
ncbi:MAG: type II toxin-antitoxin system VapC family toxin [Candidatus Solibacter usitatus]|nr:type II toxin-antitoxin system VapC family toxin [Candidatus Solibacter usitatus]